MKETIKVENNENMLPKEDFEREEPIRIQKYFTDCGVLSRRAAEAEIAAGHVRVNGEVATVGQKIRPGERFCLRRRNQGRRHTSVFRAPDSARIRQKIRRKNEKTPSKLLTRKEIFSEKSGT